jgi:hypothetical protein
MLHFFLKSKRRYVKMKKSFLVFLVAILLVVSTLGFAACSETQRVESSVTLIIDGRTIQADTDARTVHELLQQLYKKNVIKAYTFSGTAFSPYIEQVDEVKDTFFEDGKYITLFHDIEDMALQQFNLSFQPITIEAFGKTFYYSSVGVALLPIVDGATYYIFATNENYFG